VARYQTLQFIFIVGYSGEMLKAATNSRNRGEGEERRVEPMVGIVSAGFKREKSVHAPKSRRLD
jgi:hypothetical protein